MTPSGIFEQDDVDEGPRAALDSVHGTGGDADDRQGDGAGRATSQPFPIVEAGPSTGVDLSPHRPRLFLPPRKAQRR